MNYIISLVVIYIFITANFVYSNTIERKLINDFLSIPLHKSPSDILKHLSHNIYNPTLIKAIEGSVEKKLKLTIKAITIKNKQTIYDQDFYISPKPNDIFISLTQIKEYYLYPSYKANIKNLSIKAFKFLFYRDKLYNKELQGHFSFIAQPLIILTALKRHLGKAKIEEEIRYNGFNRFVWKNNKIHVEYNFYPSINKFSQRTGYKTLIKISHLSLLKEASNHVRLIKNKIIKILR